MDKRNQAHVNVTHKEKQKAIISCIATLFIFLATGLVLSVLRGFLGELFSFDSDSIVIKNIFNISAYIISGVITCILVYKDSGISLKSAFSIKKIDFSIIIAGTFGIHALQDIILQCVALALSNNIHTDASNETSITLVTIIELIFIAPIIEEIVFRFAEIELLRGKFKKVFICIVISPHFVRGDLRIDCRRLQSWANSTIACASIKAEPITTLRDRADIIIVIIRSCPKPTCSTL